MSDDRPNVSPVPATSKQGPLTPFGGEKPPAPAWFETALQTAAQERSVEVDGAQIRYLHWGDASKPGLLLTHGNGAHAHWWDFIAPYLSGAFNVAALSLGGMGDSDWRGAYTMECFAQEQLAVAEDAGMFAHAVAPVIVGHSFGGFVTILTAATHGDRLSGTILVDSPVAPPRDSGDRPPREIKPTRIYTSLAEALSRFRLAPSQECENLYLLDHVARHSLREADGGWTWKFDPHIWQRFSIGNVRERLQAITCRLAILRGQHSAIFPPEIGEYMYGLMGRAVPVVEIPEARHHILLDQPLALVAALRALLADWDHSTAVGRAMEGRP